MSGADFYALASDAILNVMKRKIAAMEIRVAQARKEQELRARQRREKAGTRCGHSCVPHRGESVDHASAGFAHDEEGNEASITASRFLADVPTSELIVLVTQDDFIETRDAEG